jgi:bacterioferritin (cytochrome b1)
MSTRNDLVAQLNGLLRLTHTETMIAEIRRAQAATEAVERELAANADKCRERSQLLTAALRDLGGVPDVVGVGAGRLAATVKSTVEQGQDLVEALFGDLALENELLARTRYAHMIAEHHGETRSLKVLDRLEEAHTATVQWLMTRLGEVAVDAPPSLRPTPMQTVAGISRRLYLLPAAQTARLANRGLETSTRLRRRAGETATTAVERSRDLIDAAGEVITAGRDAALKRTEEEATELGATRTARNVNRARRDLGAIDGDELPIRNYDSLNASSAIQRIERLRDVDDLRTVLAYEAANKARKGVINAIEGRVEHLVAELADAS